MNIINQVKIDLTTLLNQMAIELDLPPFDNLHNLTLEAPREQEHGELATNAAMLVAKACTLSPRDVATKLVQKLQGIKYIEQASLAGPGFINLRLNPSMWQNNLLTIIAQGAHYGDSDIGAGLKVNLEYVSANPTGPLHIGHARCAVYGDALASLLSKCGFAVTREYYVNDAGSQIEVLARSVYIRYAQSCGIEIGVEAGLYPGSYLIPVGQALYEKYGDSLLEMEQVEWISVIKPFTIAAMIELIRCDLAELDIHHDIFTSEQSLHDNRKIDQAVQKLSDAEVIYHGTLDPPKGKAPADWEAREQMLFRSTDFGDDIDRALQKSDGSWTYFAADCAYALDKLERGFKEMIIILGADHLGYVKRMKALTSALSGKTANLDIKICQLVNFIQDNQVLKMSKRSGNFETVRDVVSAVGRDIVRFIMLSRKNDVSMDFDLQKVQEQSKDNPVFYVQYANARAHSVWVAAQGAIPAIADKLALVTEEMLARLIEPHEMVLIRLLAFWPRFVENAAIHHEPHRITFYLQDLSAEFHSMWNKGREDKQCRMVIEGDEGLTIARLALVRAVALVIESGFKVIGVTPIYAM